MRRVVYLLSGPSHLMNLAVSLYTLRKHWSGLVTVFAWPESYDIARLIADAYGADCKLRIPQYRGRMDQPLDRILLPKNLPGDIVLYLDADTTVHGAINYLFDVAEQVGYAATQFCDWWSTDRRIAGRILDLRGIEGIPAELIDKLTTVRYPSVNCGIFASAWNSPVLDTWYAWTDAAKGRFIADEKTQHLLQANFSTDQFVTVCCCGRYNCSPKYQSEKLQDKDVAVFHHHGDCNVRPDKCRRAVEIWYPIYRELLRSNVADMKSWRGSVRNRWLDRLDAQYAKDTVMCG